MSFGNFFYLSYWFSQPDPAAQGVRSFWIIFFLVFLVLGIAALIIRSTKNEKAIHAVLGRYANVLLTMGITGLLWFTFRQENVYFLSWRFWMGLWFVVIFLWLGSIVRYTVRRLPHIKAENKEREIRERYLPKARK